MSKSPPGNRSRKRIRQLHFDLNRSTPHVARKVHKPNTPSIELNTKMSKKSSDQIRDLSETIMSGRSGNQQSAGSLTTDLDAQSISKQAMVVSMEDKIKRLVDQSVSSQMSDLRKAIAELTSSVSRISVVVQQTQQENKKLRYSNLASTSKEQHPQKLMDTSQTPVGSKESSRSSSVNSHEYARNENRLRMDKWGLEFNGDNNNLAVEDFVFRLERLQFQYGVPWKEVMDNFHLLVKGAAEKWYWLFIRTNYVTEWNTLKEALLKQYQTTRSSFELMRDMVERRQLPGESIDDFFFAMIQLRSRLSISMPEAEIIKMIKKNVRENIGRIVYPMSVSTVEELRICCIDAEKTFLRKDTRAQQAPITRYPRHINELYEEPISQRLNDELCNEEVSEINVRHPTNQPARILVCWNCQQDGHMFMDCPSDQRAIFCYKCGKPDVTSPNCSDCRKRNFSRNEGKAEDHRSTINPQKDLQRI